MIGTENSWTPFLLFGLHEHRNYFLGAWLRPINNLYLIKWTLEHPQGPVHCQLSNILVRCEMLLLFFFFLLMYAIGHYISNIMHKFILCIHSSLPCVNYLFSPKWFPGLCWFEPWSKYKLLFYQRMPFSLTNNWFAWQDRVLSDEVLLWRQDLIHWEN